MCDHYYKKKNVKGNPKWICVYCGSCHKFYTRYYENHLHGRFTEIGYLSTGQYFMLDGRKYRVGHCIKGTDGYVACTDITEYKRVVRRFHVDTIVEEVKKNV